MNFWERVDELLKEQNLTRKALAITAHFDVSNIAKGIKNNNIPSADTALKIAQILGTSVEYLLTGTDPSEKINFESRTSPKTKEINKILGELSDESRNKLGEILKEVCNYKSKKN